MARKLKVLLVVDSYTPGVDGVVNVVKHLYEYFSQNNECKIICPAYPSYEKDSNIFRVKSIKLKNKPFPIPLVFLQRRKMKKFVREFKPDIIHVHSPFAIGKFGIAYARKNNIPYVFTLHTKFDQDLKKSLPGILAPIRAVMFSRIMSVINKCEYVYSPSPAMQEWLDMYEYKYGKLSGYFTNHTELLPTTNYKGAVEEINLKFDIEKDKLVGVLVARILKYKGLQSIIDTMVELKRRKVFITMLIVGDGADLAWMKNEVAKKDIKEYFVFTGMIKDRELINKIMCRANFSFLASAYDTSSLTIKEAACNKTPTLGIINTTTTWQIKNMNDGYLCENTGTAFADCIVSMIDNKEQYENICNNAFNNLYQTWDQYFPTVEAEYEKIIENWKK